MVCIPTERANDVKPNSPALGRMPTKIVGVRFYNGLATTGERVLLVREPTNPYDRNAIQVRNVMGDQIGHIGRFVAAKLAPYMVRNFGQTNTHVCLINHTI